MAGSNFVRNIRLIFTVSGIAAYFLGERYFSSSPIHWWVSGSGAMLMLLGVFLTLFCLLSAKKRGYIREVKSWVFPVVWQTLVLFSCLFYYLYVGALGGKSVPDTFGAKLFLILWLLPLVLGVFMGVGVEWAQINNGRGQYSEPQRVRLAAQSWLRVGLLGVIIAALNYTAARKNKAWDLSYLKTTKPSSSTFQMIEGLSDSVDVALFFPLGNEVLPKAQLYIEELKNRSPKLAIHFWDMEINPVAAEEYKVSRNGFVVLRSGSQTERFDLGLTLDGARKGLKNLDSEFQKALVGVTQKKKTLYFTRGHGELTWVSDEKESNGLKSIRKLENYLRSSGYTLRFFGISDGAANQVPPDADAVVVVGGDLPFMPEEARVIQNYVDSGGKLIMLLDVEVPTTTTLSTEVRDASKDPLIHWLKESGADYNARVLANVSNHLKATSTEADTWFLFSNVYTSHSSVQSLARNEQRAALITLKSGFFVTKDDGSVWNVFDTVRSLSDTFVDENRNFRFDDKSEKREPRVIGVALEQKILPSGAKSKGRIAAFADATLISDALVPNPANLVYFVDSLRWLFGEASVMGLASSEEDIPIRHSNNEDIAWFYGTVALVPGLVLLAGRFATSRARRMVRLTKQEEKPSGTPGGAA